MFNENSLKWTVDVLRKHRNIFKIHTFAFLAILSNYTQENGYKVHTS